MRNNRNTKAFKTLQFIHDAGSNGVSYAEIHKHIYINITNHTIEQYNEVDYDYNTGKPSTQKSKRCCRGFWSSNLNGSKHSHKGLLYWCTKLPNNKYILPELPEPHEKLYVDTAYTTRYKELTKDYNQRRKNLEDAEIHNYVI